MEEAPEAVSIRSPYRSKGRLEILTACIMRTMFQSAPLTEARGDAALLEFERLYTCFNPLPLPKQGEIQGGRDVRCDGVVSIRSPYRSKGR